jgi:HEAT repeat protein
MTRMSILGIWLLFGIVLVAVPRTANGELDGYGAVDSGDGHGPADRVKRATEGHGIADQAKRLTDPDPTRRIAALHALAESGDPAASQYVANALDDTDPRVQLSALDSLVRLKAKDFAPAIAQRLFWNGVSKPLRQRILVSLGQLGEPDSAASVFDFANQETDRDLRGAALSTVGQIGDASIEPRLRSFAEHENDPTLKRLAEEALRTISSRRSPPSSASP